MRARSRCLCSWLHSRKAHLQAARRGALPRPATSRGRGQRSRSGDNHHPGRSDDHRCRDVRRDASRPRIPRGAPYLGRQRRPSRRYVLRLSALDGDAASTVGSATADRRRHICPAAPANVCADRRGPVEKRLPLIRADRERHFPDTYRSGSRNRASRATSRSRVSTSARASEAITPFQLCVSRCRYWSVVSSFVCNG